MIALKNLFQIVDAPHESARLIARREADGWQFLAPDEAPFSTSPSSDIYLVPTSLVGDAPDKYHPLYAAAILWRTEEDLKDASLPTIAFTTDEATRRSMTLNAMRMTLEHFHTGSMRVLELIANRLEAGQRDIAHDALVYLMRREADVRAAQAEAEQLCSDSLAAWLGLEPNATRALLMRAASAEDLAARLEADEAGILRRKLDLPAVCRNQWAQLQPERNLTREEQDALFALVQNIRTRLGP